jgi:GNAT superfamily N-acetyltransferase
MSGSPKSCALNSEEASIEPEDHTAPQQPFTVRRATAEDSAQILHCLREAFEPYRQAYTLEAFGNTVPTPVGFEKRLTTMSIFAATSADGAIIGTIGSHQVNKIEGHIRGMAVRAAWHGSGAAQQLLETAEIELRATGCRRITLDTTEPLRRAVSFYLRNGFHPTGLVRDFFGMPLYEYAKELTTSS